MARRTIATKWEVTVRDKTGAMVNMDYICSYCHTATGEYVLIGVDSVNKIDSNW